MGTSLNRVYANIVFYFNLIFGSDQQSENHWYFSFRTFTQNLIFILLSHISSFFVIKFSISTLHNFCSFLIASWVSYYLTFLGKKHSKKNYVISMAVCGWMTLIPQKIKVSILPIYSSLIRFFFYNLFIFLGQFLKILNNVCQLTGIELSPGISHSKYIKKKIFN